MTQPRTTDACPYCLAEKIAEASICPVCNRDIIVPTSLLDERDELIRRRDRLRNELDAKQKRLAAR